MGSLLEAFMNCLGSETPQGDQRLIFQTPSAYQPQYLEGLVDLLY